MPNNPDARDPRYGAHVFTVEDLDLSEHGMPGFAFTGDLHIEPDDTPGVLDWYIAEIRAPDGSTAMHDTAIIRAVLADAHLCDLITEACIEHGEG